MLFSAKDKTTVRIIYVFTVLFLSLLFFTPRSVEAKKPHAYLQNQINDIQDFQNAHKDSSCPKGSVMHGIDADGNILCTVLHPSKYVFVTSQTYPANFGGVEIADDICQNLASGAELPGIYKAWLSDETLTSSPSNRFANVGHAAYYMLTDDTTIVAEGWNDLTDGELGASISIDENGDSVLANELVFTKTAVDGTRLEHDLDYVCQGWKDDTDAYDAVVGESGAVNRSWTANSGRLCDNPHRFYCFQQ